MRRYVPLVLVALLLTLASAVYQRLTGPTHPARFGVEIGGETYKVRLVRSGDTGEPAIARLKDLAGKATAVMTWRRHATDDPWATTEFAVDGSDLVAPIPPQPAAGKVQYFVTVTGDGVQTTFGSADDPVIIRFKGAVPAGILVPHICFMFTSMLFAMMAMLEAMTRGRRYLTFGYVSMALLLAGGFVFGPLVQKYAFDAYWTGWPYGGDLTDNKTLIALIGWVVALGLSARVRKPWWTIGAALIMISIFTIPHSMRGSSLDPKSGQVISE